MFISDQFIAANFNVLPMDVESNWNNLPKKSKETIIHRLELASQEGSFDSVVEAPWLLLYLPIIFCHDVEDYHWNLWSSKRSAYILAADYWIKGKSRESLLMVFYATFLEESLARGMDVVYCYYHDEPKLDRISKAFHVDHTQERKICASFDVPKMYSYFAYLHRAVVSTTSGRDMTMFLIARLKELPGTSKWIGLISRMKHMPAKVHTSTPPVEKAKPQKLMKLTCLAENSDNRLFDLHVYQDTLFNWVSNVILVSYRIYTHKLLTGSISKVKPQKSFRLPSLVCSRGGKFRIFYTVTSRMKTMNELGIQDGDTVIPIHFGKSGTPYQQSRNNDNKSANDKKPTVKERKSNGKGKRQKKKSKVPSTSKQEQLVNDHIALREAHSKSMEPVLNELRPLLKIRRDKIASYYLQKAPPKVKKPIKAPKKSDTHLMSISSNVPLISGKAGKSVYPVLVGEVNNLYKSSKKKFRSLSSSQTQTITLDLHACSRYKALGVLRKHLPKWIDIAMKGEHPFVIPVDIVCGGGNQILSELVAQFIRDNPQIANRPRGKL